MSEGIEAYKLFRQLEERRKRANPYKFYDKDELIDEILKLEDKVEELMTLYTTEREVKEDYKFIIKEAREYIEAHIKYECDDAFNGKQFYSYHLYDFDKKELLEILDRK